MSSTAKVPKIVLLGPTNVGKSALFNRMTRSRRAIVCDRPGVTVDRHEMFVEESPAGPIEVVDTGGVGPRALEHPFGEEIQRAASQAIKEADLVLFVVDGTRELGMEELEIASWYRKQEGIDKIPIWIVSNKADSKKHNSNSYYSLGFDPLFAVSAEHGEGMDLLWEEIARIFNWVEESSGQEEEAKLAGLAKTVPRVVVLGRPNAGKSTLLNTLLGHERHVVSETAGTTRDPIESEYHHRDLTWRLVDTAGIRQPGRLEREVEWVAREKLKDIAKQADVAVVVLDSTQGVTDLDAAIAGMAIDFGLSLVLAFNKWDKMTGEEAQDLWDNLQRSSDLKLDFIKWCPWVKISALTGKSISELLKKIQVVLKTRSQRVQTSRLNQVFERKLRLHSHPVAPGGRVAKFYYLSQVSVSPPEFVLFSNISGRHVHFSYKRYIVNTIRQEFGFQGTPIKVHFKVTKDNIATR